MSKLYLLLSRGLPMLLAVFVLGCARGESGRANEPQISAAESLSLSASESPCEEGLASFAKTLHPLVRTRCSACHDSPAPGPAQGPPHSVRDVKASYGRLLVYQNFADVKGSFFVKRGGNQHCKTLGIDCAVDFDELAKVVGEWWEGGQKNCPRTVAFKTKSLTLTRELPAQGFTRLSWDLGETDRALAGVVLEIEAQAFGGGQAYRFRRPRIASASKALRVRGLRLLLNERVEPTADSFVSVEQEVPKLERSEGETLRGPVLSGETAIVIAEKPGQDEIAIGFDEIETLPGSAACRAPEEFAAKVLPVMRVRSCFTCHGGQNESGVAAAREAWSMKGSVERLCDQAVARTQLGAPERSPFFAYPLRKGTDHPMVIPRREEIARWFDWVAAEREARSRD